MASSITNIFSINDNLGVVIVGNLNDARFVVTWLRQTSAQFKFKNGYCIPVSVLAKQLGHHLQKFSQYAVMRTLCVNTTLVGHDDEFGPQLYRIDPSG